MSQHAPRVSVVIPTIKRPDGLTRAIDSILLQEGVPEDDAEIVVVDNDPEGSAEQVVHRFNNSRFALRYVHEPSPGVANARNAAISAINSRLIAFLDDDESAPPTWLATLLNAHEQYNAAVTFGPVITALPADNLEHAEYLKAFFARKGPEESGVIDDFYGCGNSLFDMEQMPEGRPLFDTRANETGGEDDFLFHKLDDLGKRFAWAADASVFEHVPASRATLRYTLRRSFAYGQSPSTMCVSGDRFNLPGLLFWMAVGLGQGAVYGCVALAMMLVRAKRRAFWYDKTMQGIGKVLWFGPFEFKFYGLHAT